MREEAVKLFCTVKPAGELTTLLDKVAGDTILCDILLEKLITDSKTQLSDSYRNAIMVSDDLHSICLYNSWIFVDTCIRH